MYKGLGRGILSRLTGQPFCFLKREKKNKLIAPSWQYDCSQTVGDIVVTTKRVFFVTIDLVGDFEVGQGRYMVY